jgi:N-acetylglucosaminyldiphosphoundecaprenol N-acetyl-beta-D-mannosaminyltransferase
MYLRNGPVPWDDAATEGIDGVAGVSSGSAVLAEAAPSRVRLVSRDGRNERLPVVQVHGVTVHSVTEAGAVKYILDELAAGRGGTVVTPNLDHLRRCEKDMSFRALVAEADLVVADGMPLIWASKVQGTPLPERVAGSDLISSLSAAAAEHGRSIFLLGGDPGTAEAAAKVLQQRHPRLKVVGTLCPPYGFDKKDEEMRRIESALSAARPDIVFVALGSPKQEMLVERIRRVLPAAWWLGIGNSFSFLSGQVRRAPVWMQKHGLEWIHRLLQEPKRLFKRYIVFGVPFASRMFTRSAMVGLPKKFGKGRGAAGAGAAPGVATEAGARAGSIVAEVAPRMGMPVVAPVAADPVMRVASRPVDGQDGEMLRKLRAVVLLAGAVRPMAIATETGRSILDLPLDTDKTFLKQWVEHTEALARVAGLPGLGIRAMVNGHSPDPIGAVSAAHLVRVERDFGEYRGTGGLLRDLAREYDDEDLILVANAFQLLIDPLADVARAVARLGGDVGLVSHHDGTPSGIMLIRCKTLRLISEAGYVDMKEQALPQIASRYEVSVLHRRRPTGLPVRTLGDYVGALRTYHRRKSGRAAITTDPLAEDWRPTFSVVEEGASVDPLASVHDSVVLRGARLEAGAVAVRSVVCPRGIVRRDVPAVDQFVTAGSGGREVQ